MARKKRLTRLRPGRTGEASGLRSSYSTLESEESEALDRLAGLVKE